MIWYGCGLSRAREPTEFTNLTNVSSDVTPTHYLYPLNPKSNRAYVLRRRGKEVPTSRKGFFDLLDYGSLDKWGVSRNGSRIRIGDWIWVHFALPHSELGAVGRVEREARWQQAWKRDAIWIRWDRELTERLRQNPIPFAAYRQVPQFSATSATTRTARMLDRWLANKRTLAAKSRDARVVFRTAEVEQRIGQPEFRAELLRAYRNRCAVTGCAIPEALQAAHIRPVRSSGSHSAHNGLLLRADLHNLFDRGLLTVGSRYIVRIDKTLLVDPAYRKLDGKRLRVVPATRGSRPSRQLLQEHQDFHRRKKR